MVQFFSDLYLKHLKGEKTSLNPLGTQYYYQPCVAVASITCLSGLAEALIGALQHSTVIIPSAGNQL